MRRAGGIDGSGVKEETGASATVVPHGQGGSEMTGIDERSAIKGGIDGAQAEDLASARLVAAPYASSRPWLKPS